MTLPRQRRDSTAEPTRLLVEHGEREQAVTVAVTAKARSEVFRARNSLRDGGSRLAHLT
jgi:hypothetical protein